MQHYTLLNNPISIDRNHFFSNGGFPEVYSNNLLFGPAKIVRRAYSTSNAKYKSNISINTSVASSKHSYINFKRRANESLIEINNNLSCLLQDTFKGIDNICNRVRQCLDETTSTNKINSCPYTVDEIHSKHEILSTDVSLLEENGDDDVTVVGEKTKKEINDNYSETSLIEEKSVTLIEDVKKPVVSSFITEINSIPTKENDKVDAKIKTHFDEIKKAMKQIEEAGDFDNIMSEMVNNIHSNIEKSCSSLEEIYKTGQKCLRSLDIVQKQYAKLPSNKKNESKQKINKQSSFDNNYCGSNNDLLPETIPSYNEIPSQSKKGILPKLDFSPADVYRKRAFTDLNEKLKSQLEANDSLLFFQRLMEKTRRKLAHARISVQDGTCKTRAEKEKAKAQELESFNAAFSKFTKITDLSKKYENSLWFNVKSKGKIRKGKTEVIRKKGCKKSVSDKTLSRTGTIDVRPMTAPGTNKKKCLNHGPGCSCKMTVTNDEPITTAEKCRLHWMRAKQTQMNKKLKYLDILDDITAKDVLPLKSEYPRQDNTYSPPKHVKETYLYKLMYGKKKETNKAWCELFEPSIKCSKKNCMECQEDKCVKEKIQHDSKIQSMQSRGDDILKNMSKKDVIKKLSKYMFAVDEFPKKNILTVMPVQVFYDKLPLNPMKEAVNLKRAEWQNPSQHKPLKVFYERKNKDLKPSSARNEKIVNITNKNLKSNSLTPKSFSNICKLDNTDKIPKSPQSNIPHKAPSICTIHPASPSCSARTSTNVPYIKPPVISCIPHQNQAKTGQKQELPKAKPVNVKISKLSQWDYLNLESSIRPKMSEEQRRLQAHKYGKAVSQKLMDFVEKQKPPYETPVPSHAKPKNLDDKLRQKNMLTQLHNLKQKNDMIQCNIQKAIDVIEHKMTDILSQPGSSSNLAAFNEMEREITDVLNMMKSHNKRPQHKLSNFHKEKKKNVEDVETDNISNELFNKLAKILDSTTACSSTNSSKMSVRVRSPRRRQKPIKTNSTTTTLSSDEEKVIITSFSPKNRRLKLEHVDVVNKDRPSGDNNDDSDSEKKPEKLVLSDRSQGDCTSDIKKELVREIDDILEDIEENNKEIANEKVQVAISCNSTSCDKLLTSFGTEPVKEIITDSVSKQTDTKDTDTGSLNDSGDKISSMPSTDQKIIENENEIDDDLPKKDENILNIENNIDTVETTGNTLDSPKSKDITLESICEEQMDSNNFCENVDKIIMRVENIYNTLNDFEDENTPRDITNCKRNIPIFRETHKEVDINSETFLTPFMKELKDRHMESPRKSASYYNVLSFLDTLTDVTCEKPIEVHTARLVYFARAVHFPITYHMATIVNYMTLSGNPRQSCLKKDTEDNRKIEKKVSFRLKTEDKDTQVRLCAKHLSEHNKTVCRKPHNLPNKDESSQNTDSFVTAESQTEETENAIQDEINDINFNINNILDNIQNTSSENTAVDSSNQAITVQENVSSDSCQMISTESVANNVALCSEQIKEYSSDSEERKEKKDKENKVCKAVTSKSNKCKAFGDKKDKIECKKNKKDKNIEGGDNNVEINCCKNRLDNSFSDSESSDRSRKKNRKIESGDNIFNIKNNFKDNISDTCSYSSQNIKIFHETQSSASIVKVLDNKISEIYDGIFGKDSLEFIKTSSTTLNSLEKKRSSVAKLLEKSQISEERNILQPLKNVNDFMDVELLKKAVQERQEQRLLRRRSSALLVKNKSKREENIGSIKKIQRDNVVLLKGFYAIVYIIVFTALNLEYKCV